ncbi:hypothetical protein B6U66_02610 [Candidatus Bathyarchaeota archaeon ex4484_135]|nr:MAG: hypothetical protein B6U66_02610 [Candidatus Bathyarchaeota archaeon ex4484_135]
MNTGIDTPSCMRALGPIRSLMSLEALEHTTSAFSRCFISSGRTSVLQVEKTATLTPSWRASKSLMADMSSAMGPMTVTAIFLKPMDMAFSTPDGWSITALPGSRGSPPFCLMRSITAFIGLVLRIPDMMAPMPWTSPGSQAMTVPAPSQTTTAQSRRPSSMHTLIISELPKGTSKPMSRRLWGQQKPNFSIFSLTILSMASLSIFFIL